MTGQRRVLLVVGAYVWLMMILFGTILLETLMVYPNIFHDPPASFSTALAFMKVRAPSDFYPPFGLLSWVLGTASTLVVWRLPGARRWMLLSVSMIVCEGLLSMALFWPRNTIMFIEGPAVHSPEVLRQVAVEFQRLHWLRVICNAVASSAAFMTFLVCYRNWIWSAADEQQTSRQASATAAVDARHDRSPGRTMPRRFGRVMLTGVSVVLVIGTAVADLSALHAQNPTWPPHARFHAIWHVLHVAAVQCVAMALLWVSARRQTVLRVTPAAEIMGAYALSFLVAAVVAPLFGASMTPDVPLEQMPVRPLGLDGNLLSVLIVTPTILVGWLLARHGRGQNKYVGNRDE